ncbi:MAG TPA: hypothetical protein VGK22_06230 [Candidatus Angelobacter sp.]|jgi:hypothetical protein
MSDKEKKNEIFLATQQPLKLSIRKSLISRGLKNISEDERMNMYTWLDSLPHGSILFSLNFPDESEFPTDDRDVSYLNKHHSEMSKEEEFLALTQESCTGLLSLRAFGVDAQKNKYPHKGYIEIEGIHPFERSLRLTGGHEKEKLMSAIGALVRSLLVAHNSMRIYCDGDTLLRFHSFTLEEIQAFVEQVNSTLHTTVVNIRKPDGTVAKRKSGLYLELTEYK